jgi:Helix-loop-helix DNA-binding domain
LENMNPNTSKNDRPNKRERESEQESDGIDDLPAEALAQMSRSERKRHREKKRRSDVNKGFDDLTSLLWEIDPTMRSEVEERAQRSGQSKGGNNSAIPEDSTLMSRVDLISRTVQVLRRIYNENEKNKSIIAALSQSRSMLATTAFNVNDQETAQKQNRTRSEEVRAQRVFCHV